MDKKHFSRNRKQSFAGTVLFMLNFLTKSLLEFSGYCDHSIRQDVFCALLASNIQSLITQELNDEMSRDKTKIYTYNFLRLHEGQDIGNDVRQKQMQQIVEELKSLFKEHLIPIRPNKRNIGKYRARIKPIVTKNR